MSQHAIVEQNSQPGNAAQHRILGQDFFRNRFGIADRQRAGRAALRIELNDTWTLTPTAQMQEQKSRGSWGDDLSDFAPGTYAVKHFREEYVKDKWYQLGLTVEGQIGSFDLTYSGNYLNRDVDASFDYNFTKRLGVYGGDDKLRDRVGEAVTLQPGEKCVLTWTLPDLGGQPIGEVGIAVSTDGRATGAVILEYLRWDGVPEVRLARPKDGGAFWRQAWVNGVTSFWPWQKAFRINQSSGEGLLAYGTREWTDYTVASELAVNLGDGGVAVRVQGMRRYYAIRLLRREALQIVRVRDDEQLVLSECPFPFVLDKSIGLRATVRGTAITVVADGITLAARDDSPERLANGGTGLIVSDGMLQTDAVTVSGSSDL